MNNTKTTKRALLSSVMAMFICVAMLIGTTFAWFTDSASTAVNKIQAGNLKIQLLDENGVELDPDQPLSWKTTDTGDVLWEPNCTYNLDGFKIKNAGNLALKYKIVLKATAITNNNGKTLLDVIDWTIKIGTETLNVTNEEIKSGLGTENGIAIITDRILLADADEAISVTAHMQNTAGNDYQGLKIDGFGITVYAAQAKVENDSNGNTYDIGAKYGANAPYTPSVITVSTAAELQAALSPDVTNGEAVINLAGDIQLAAGQNWNSLAMHAYGQNIHKITINGNGFTIKGLNAPLIDHVYFGNSSVEINDLTLEGCTMNVTGEYCGAFVANSDNTISVRLSNCHLKNSTLSATGGDNGCWVGGLIGYVSGPVTITDCSVTETNITSEKDAGGLVGMISVANGEETAEITKCTVKKNVLTSNNSKYRVGELIGTSNIANVNLSNITAEENTCNSTATTTGETDFVASKWIGRTNSTVIGDTSDPITFS